MCLRACVCLAICFLVVAPPVQSEDECVPNDNCSPIAESKKIGRTNKGGYAFDYQSQRAQGCRRYRVRNTPDAVLTTMKWEDKAEIFMEVDIPACKSSKPCAWICSDLTADQPPVSGDTQLGYGLNREEHNDYPDAFRKGPKPSRYPPVSARVTGTVAGLEGERVRLTVNVTSVVYGEKPPYRFMYLIDAEGGNAFEILAPGAVKSSSEKVIGLIWDSPGTELFERLKQKGTTSLPPKGGRVAVEDIEGKTVVLEDAKDKRLVLLQGTKRIFAMTAPAYHPER